MAAGHQCACLEMSSLHPPALLLYFLPFHKKKPKYLHLLGSRRLQSELLGKLLEYLKVVDDLPGKQSIFPSPMEITGARRDQLHIKSLLTIESLPMRQLCSTAEQLVSAEQEWWSAHVDHQQKEEQVFFVWSHHGGVQGPVLPPERFSAFPWMQPPVLGSSGAMGPMVVVG